VSFNEKSKVQDLVKLLNAKGSVILSGNQKDIVPYHKKSSIFTSTSRSEGFPNVIGEAMSARLPVVAFDCVAGPSDLIINGENGFLIPLNDGQLFTEKLQYLIDNQSVREKYSKNAKTNMAQYELKYICKQYESFIIDNN
jgi:glycosyltransferase involved in cell wall biosynthesis